MSFVCRGAVCGWLAMSVGSMVAGCNGPVTNIRPVSSQPDRGSISHEDLDATLWMRTSAEYSIITESIYEVAWQHVAAKMREPTYAAWPVPAGSPQPVGQDPSAPGQSQSDHRPFAVILDVDETVLDNSAFQVQLILKNSEYDPDAWNAFCQRGEAVAVPGAQRFIQRCRKAGVAVFFVTNRNADEQQATCQNLDQLDMLPAADPKFVHCKGEQPEWTSDKQSRRQQIAESHRVLALIGDDLNDFVSVGYKATASDRKRLAQNYSEMWGQGWFMLPNADYGGWERAIYDWNDALPRPQKLRRKLESLRQSAPSP